MNNHEIAENLKQLAQLDMDAAWMYDRALNKIEQEDVRMELSEMRDEHMEHFENLAQFIRQLGEQPPRHGYSHELSEGLKPVTDDMDTDQVLITLRNNEKVISERMQSLADDVQIPEINEEIEDDLDDERIHMNILGGMAK